MTLPRSLACVVALTTLPLMVASLKCFDCYGTGPDHASCTEERSCRGIACMIFDAGDNQTASAFCLLAMKGTKMEEQKDGCWLERDGRGKHCMCFSDFCNKLVERKIGVEADPMTPLLPDAQFLRQNPLVDYDTPKLDNNDDEDNGAAPAPGNLLFPAAVRQDPRTAGGDVDDEDFVPVNFEDYKDTDAGKEAENGLPAEPVSVTVEKTEEDKKAIEGGVSSANRQSSVMLFFFPMATAWTRFLMSF